MTSITVRGKFVGQIKTISLREELFLKLISYRSVLQQRPKSGNRKLFFGLGNVF